MKPCGSCGKRECRNIWKEVVSMDLDFTLANCQKIPCPGFGTWQINGTAAESAVAEALRAGYRHIDTAAAYENEQYVGSGIKRSGVPRSKIFITTKLSNRAKTYNDAVSELEGSLRSLGTDSVDLCLIHWPNPLKFRSCWRERNAELWHALCDMQKSGKVISIGVSNFCPRHIDALLEQTEVLPNVNQIRLCPGDVDAETVAYCESRGILIEAYSPLGTGKAFQAEKISALAEKRGKTVSQLCLRWSLQKGFLPIVKSTSPEHIKENLGIFDFALESEDMAILDGLTGQLGQQSNPDEKPF